MTRKASPMPPLQSGAEPSSRDRPAGKRFAIRMGALCLLVTLGYLVLQPALERLRLTKENAVWRATRDTLCAAQVRFRYGDREGVARGRYGSLEELRAAGLIGEELASGRLHGHRIRVILDADRRRAWHIAEPEDSGEQAARHYYVLLRGPSVSGASPTGSHYFSPRPVPVSSADFPAAGRPHPPKGLIEIASSIEPLEAYEAALAASAARRKADAVDGLAVDRKDQRG